MIDIRTAPSAADNPLYLPFDWRMLPVPAGSGWTDEADPFSVITAGVDVEILQAVELDDTLHTAVIISLFTDRRADDDTVLPVNQTDRRGWCGDEFMTPASANAAIDKSESWGSHLWLCYVTKSVVDVLERARFAAWEALQWLVRDGIADRIVVEASWSGADSNRLALRPRIFEAGNLKPVYDVLWGTTVRKVPA
jgi:phage gp46-like protein